MSGWDYYLTTRSSGNDRKTGGSQKETNQGRPHSNPKPDRRPRHEQTTAVHDALGDLPLLLPEGMQRPFASCTQTAQHRQQKQVKINELPWTATTKD